MSEKARYMTFYENWVEVMEMCTPDEWYELTKIITNLRFKNIDTDPKTITNIKIKMAWNLIRPSILKSNRNTRYQDNKANKTADITPNTEFDNTMTTGLPTVKIEEQQTINEDITVTLDNHSEELNKFLDDYTRELNNIFNAIAEYYVLETDEKLITAQNAKAHLERILKDSGLSEKDRKEFDIYAEERVGYKIENLKDYERELKQRHLV